MVMYLYFQQNLPEGLAKDKEQSKKLDLIWDQLLHFSTSQENTEVTTVGQSDWYNISWSQYQPWIQQCRTQTMCPIPQLILQIFKNQEVSRKMLSISWTIQSWLRSYWDCYSTPLLRWSRHFSSLTSSWVPTALSGERLHLVNGSLNINIYKCCKMQREKCNMFKTTFLNFQAQQSFIQKTVSLCAWGIPFL